MKNNELIHIPIIALSGEDRGKTEEEGYGNIFDEICNINIIIVQKPITEYQLKLLLDNHIFNDD